MTRELMISWFLLIAGGIGLVVLSATSEKGVGTIYVKPVPAANQVQTWTETQRTDSAAVFSPYRTAGVWLAAFLTLAVFSYLYKDNVFYKLAESMIVGVSAGYYLVANFWDSIVALLMTELTPQLVRNWALPSLSETKTVDPWFLVPLVLSLFLFCRFVPRLSWLARWPLAFVVGTFAGLRLVSILDADFISQIRSTIVPLIVLTNGSFNVWASIRNLGLLLSVVTCLAYFFFSVPHQGLFGKVSRVGVWVLMITFGASFAFTVMGRITLLTRRFEFLFIDWLRLIDP
ncbi:hypothetical protein GC163_01890 [bacterium]|nr:hypothetical protein [bacterium]